MKLKTEKEISVSKEVTMNETLLTERTHIGIFGKTNSGKSSLINALTSQNVSIVSEVSGTTTDPVMKTMELLPLGPVAIYDTPGLDDKTALGELRIKRTKDILNNCHIAVIVISVLDKKDETEKEIINICKEKNIPYIEVYNKCDLKDIETDKIKVSAKTGENIEKLKKLIGSFKKEKETFFLGDTIKENDSYILVTPIDESAPKGRIILPQQQILREILDNKAFATVVQPKQLETVLKTVTPKLIITDSQAFKEVSEIVPDDIELTSFSILFARKKGNLKQSIDGANKLDEINDNDKILISEGCTHHRQCNDIGTVKLPNLIRKYTKKQPEFVYTSGKEFPDDLSEFKLVIHCGGCMLTDKEVENRYKAALIKGIPMTNYGIAIAKMNGILKRTTKMF